MKFSVGIVTLLIFLTFNLSQSKKIRYDGYKGIRLIPTTKEALSVISELENLGIIFLENPSKLNANVDLLLPPHLQGDILDYLKSSSVPAGLKVITMVDDFQKLIDTELVNGRGARFNWDEYQPFQEYQNFLNEQATTHPDMAQLFNIGESFERRPLSVLRIRKPGGNFRPAIWIDSNIHAREWITGAVVTKVIDELLNGENEEVKAWLDEFDWYFLPIANPDGFEFTHTTNRLWRKTRSRTNSILGCRGADPNRNFGYKWLTGGSSNVPCDDTYAGPRAFSEIETARLGEFYRSIAADVKCFISVHSYSQFVMFPYGLVDEQLEPEEYANYTRIGNKVAEAMAERYGTQFDVGSITDLLYPASGGSIDWIKNEFDTYLTFAFELRDKGEFGFVLPPEQIKPSAEEFIDGLRVFLEELRTAFPSTKNNNN